MNSAENLVEMANISIDKSCLQEVEIIQIQQKIGWTHCFAVKQFYLISKNLNSG